MLRLQTCTSLCLQLLTACGGGKGTTDSTEGDSTSSDSHRSSGDGTCTTAPTTSSASTTATTATVADTGEVTSSSSGVAVRAHRTLPQGVSAFKARHVDSLPGIPTHPTAGVQRA